MSVFDIFAGMAFLMLDVIAVISVVGSAILVIINVISISSGSYLRAPEKIYMWSVGGLLFGIFGFISFAISGEFSNTKETPLFNLSLTTVWLLYALSAVLFVVSQLLKRKGRRVTFPKSNRMVKQNR